jgi:CubicO group peptidase (beta-lactamase class C family)
VDDLYSYLSHYTLKRDVGAESEYSNFAVAVLGQLLARRAGTGHSESLKPVSSWEQPGAYAAAGGLKSTVNDMLTFAAANLGVRPSPVLAAMQRSHQPNETAKLTLGLGWGIDRTWDADSEGARSWYGGGTRTDPICSTVNCDDAMAFGAGAELPGSESGCRTPGVPARTRHVLEL